MEANYEIRPLSIRRDHEGLCDVIELSFKEDLEEIGMDFREELGSLKKIEPLLRFLGLFSKSMRHIIGGFVYEDQGQIISTVFVNKRGMDASQWIIRNLATHPDYRRQGLARELIKTAVEHAASHGAEVCTLEVRSDNTSAYDLYRNQGFTHFDSLITLKLEKFPEVEVVATEEYMIHEKKKIKQADAYDLAVRATPAEVAEFLPVNKKQFSEPRFLGWIEPIFMKFLRFVEHNFVAELDGKIVGAVRFNGRRTKKGVYGMNILIDPAHREKVTEPLLKLALSTIKKYPERNTIVTVRTSNNELLALLRRYDFEKIEENHRLGLKL
ncbi:MAG: GNAT family N-acetyltransferase [Candidatus Hodarchaeota archaeon]